MHEVPGSLRWRTPRCNGGLNQRCPDSSGNPTSYVLDVGYLGRAWHRPRSTTGGREPKLVGNDIAASVELEFETGGLKYSLRTQEFRK